MSSINHDDFAHLKIPFENILTATNNFDDENFRGEGGFGNYYKGQLLWSGELIDIYAQRYTKEWDEKEQQFWMEISMLSSLKHKNLASLVGFCDENDEKVIIIKFETRESLFIYLSDSMFLTWVKRLEICVGVANALSYIHYDELRDFSVIHQNIDSETILLNDNWEPKLSEFRRSMKIKASERHNSFNTDKVWSTDGYTDPTYIEIKSANNKSDIYSFGIVMFELLCGRKSVIASDYNKYLAPVAITHYHEKKLYEIIDWGLWSQMDSQSFNMFAEIAYDCLKEERSQRPDIDEIVPRIVKALEVARENIPIMSSPDDLAHFKIPLEDIRSATNNFADANIIGEHILAKRYKGQLLWSGELIDISARRFNKEYKNSEKRFWTEVSMLSSLTHQNLISFVGFCDENGEKIVISKHETRGRLDNYLSDPFLLTWVQRLKISVGLAHALSYIHYDEPRDFSVIHRRISSSTVLLNDNWQAKLSFFERSMKIKASKRHHSFHTDDARGISGYIDPIYEQTDLANHKSDMYSFGIVLFELVCGRKSIIDDKDDNRLAPLAITHYREKKLNEIIDFDMWKQIYSQSFDIFAESAYDCLNEERSHRPNIDDIVARLEKALELQLEHQNAIMPSPKDNLAHLKIPLESILSATNNFADENNIRTSRFCKEYKGQLLWSGELININARRINKERNKAEQEFWTEVSMLTSLKHKNLVSLVGFCDEKDEKVIITKYDETRGMLSKYLSDPMLLTWVQRLKISVGLAHALSYIHFDERRDFSVIHRYIDSSRVLLTDDWEPKLCDFELSMKIEASQRHHSFITYKLECVNGYGDPTYIETNTVSHKSDMYSFGIVLFELVCGRKSKSDDQDNKYLAPVAIFHYKEKLLHDLIDPDLLKQMDPQSLNVFIETAYDCLNEDRSQRPNIYEIVTRLEKALELQLECENAERPSVVHEVGGTSSSHEKGSASHFTSTGVQSNSSKKTMSSLKYLSHSQFSFEDIESATNNFAPENEIRDDDGTAKYVYQGRMFHSGQSIDIVVRGIYSEYQKDESKKCRIEKSMLSSLSHTNLVSVIGFSDVDMITVYKKEANGSLNNHLSDETLTWMQRLKICLGVANALSYIHYDVGRDFSVIHCNIRSSKILLDDKWEPKLSGFELALKNTVARRHRLLLTRDIIENVYLDPKYKKTGGMTHKSDVTTTKCRTGDQTFGGDNIVPAKSR